MLWTDVKSISKIIAAAEHHTKRPALPTQIAKEDRA
jgi:hypothetical protein